MHISLSPVRSRPSTKNSCARSPSERSEGSLSALRLPGDHAPQLRPRPRRASPAAQDSCYYAVLARYLSG